MEEALKLSVTRTWGNRTLDTSSTEWRRLRARILSRDNHTCRFCDIRSSKYMVCDHIDGNASNNADSNPRIICPSCDSIRHCGLSIIKGWIELRLSNMSQKENVKKTQRYVSTYGEAPRPEQIDPNCSPISNHMLSVRNTEKQIPLTRPISLPNALMEHNYEDLAGIEIVRGFPNSNFRYLDFPL